ncbi:MAG: hypothetical protein HY811_00690 [Planctomycetes bacterium]|nr:hypothetical protein [Planctomycetota bacterium]
MITPLSKINLFIKGRANWFTIALFFLLLSIISFGISGFCNKYEGNETEVGSSGISQITSPAPPGGTVDIPITATLSWEIVPGATHYAVYFGLTTDGLSPVTNTMLTNYEPGILEYNTTYYWRVDPNNINQVVIGQLWSFTTMAQATNSPPQANTPNPANGATNIPAACQLSWAAATGTNSYTIYCGTSSPPPLVTTSTVTAYHPGILAYNTTYYWRIDSNNNAGTTQGVVWSFKTKAPPVNPPAQATNPTPANGATNIIANTQLSWAMATDATSYDVYFGTVNPPPLKITTLDTTYNPGTLNNNTAYYWRVNSKNIVGTTQGAVWNFTTRAQETAPNPPSGLTATALSSSQVVISWTDNSGDETGFIVERKTGPAGTYAVITTLPANTGVYTDISAAPFTTYYYRLAACNASGNSAYSNEASAVTFNRIASGTMVLQWKAEGDNLRIRVSAPATGWISVGFDATNRHQDANIIIGYISNGRLFIQDDYGTGSTTHSSDISLGGTDNITEKTGAEANGTTELVFTIPLNSGDSRDKPLVVGNSYNVILGYGNTDNFTGMHAFARTINIKIQ